MITAKDVTKAHKILRGVVVNTPLEYDHYLSENMGQNLFEKENAQRVRSSRFVERILQFLNYQKRSVSVGCLCFSGKPCARGCLYL